MAKRFSHLVIVIATLAPNLPQAQVYEVASPYHRLHHHLDRTKNHQTTPA